MYHLKHQTRLSSQQVARGVLGPCFGPLTTPTPVQIQFHIQIPTVLTVLTTAAVWLIAGKVLCDAGK